jgi:hypothetical protein
MIGVVTFVALKNFYLASHKVVPHDIADQRLYSPMYGPAPRHILARASLPVSFLTKNKLTIE